MYGYGVHRAAHATPRCYTVYPAVHAVLHYLGIGMASRGGPRMAMPTHDAIPHNNIFIINLIDQALLRRQ